ncbi:MAG: tetratricopeptide repeat protein [Gammaproteobacteria bacterium]|nr:tetratricopeptide repeat protein [Gammaproteobacteria bacterium]
MEFETEEQQIEAIKKWWKEYGLTIAAGLILGLAGIFGFRYFTEQRELKMAETSGAYESVLAILKEQNDKDKFMTEASIFKIAHSDTIYSNLLSFQLAKLAVDADDLGTAGQHLRDILNNPQHGSIEHIARIRLGRILLEQGEADKALAIIADAVGGEYQSSYELLRGDIWMLKGDRNRARQAYEAAKSNSTDGPENPNLEMLLTDLYDETAIAEVE